MTEKEKLIKIIKNIKNTFVPEDFAAERIADFIIYYSNNKIEKEEKDN